MTATMHKAQPPITGHETHCETLMAHAVEMLEQEDRAQASEKAWGAFAHQVHIICDQRHWEYVNHAQMWYIIMALIDENERADVATLHADATTANRLHENYRRDEMELDEIAESHIAVRRGIATMQQIAQRYAGSPEYRAQADALCPPNSRYVLRARQWQPITAASETE